MKGIKQLEIKLIDIDKLMPYENNTKEHPEWQIEQICRSIEAFGFNDPIGITEDMLIVEGHGRYLAAKKLEIKKVPCFFITGMTDEQIREYSITHNKLTMNTGFDMEKLEYELNALQVEGFDLSLTGHTDYELQKILDHNDLFDNEDYTEEDLKEDYEEPNKNIVCPHCGYSADKKEFKSEGKE